MRVCTKCGSVSNEMECCDRRTVPQSYQKPPPLPMREDVQRQLFAHLPEQRKPSK